MIALPRQPRAVIFDMDGLLIDTVPVYAKAMVAASRDVGYPLTEDYFLSLVGLISRELETRMRADLGETFPLDAFMRAMVARLDPLLRAGVDMKSGAAELIAWLATAGIPSAIATSMKAADAWLHLDMHHLSNTFAQVITRDDVTNGKPLPDVYLRAASALGLPPADCLALEDSFGGIRAAHGAGCMIVMVPDVLTPTPEIAALCVGIADDLFVVRDALAG